MANINTTYTESMAGFNGFANGTQKVQPAPAAQQPKTHDVDSSSMRGFVSDAPKPKNA